MKENIYIRKIKLPMSVRAFTIPDAQGDYNIYINEALSDEQQYKSLFHEEMHIENGDFCKEEAATAIEMQMKKLLAR